MCGALQHLHCASATRASSVLHFLCLTETTRTAFCVYCLQILGDRSLKYKYINPNLLFVATAPNSQPATDSSNPTAAAVRQIPAEDQQVSVALINTVSGAVLHQQVHTGAAGPVHAVVSEHWVVYTLRDVSSMRQQVRVPKAEQGGQEHLLRIWIAVMRRAVLACSCGCALWSIKHLNLPTQHAHDAWLYWAVLCRSASLSCMTHLPVTSPLSPLCWAAHSTQSA